MMEPPVRPISYERHRFPAEVIRHAVCPYFRFTLSFRDVEELLAQRGIEVSYETIPSGREVLIDGFLARRRSANLAPERRSQRTGIPISLDSRMS